MPRNWHCTTEPHFFTLICTTLKLKKNRQNTRNSNFIYNLQNTPIIEIPKTPPPYLACRRVALRHMMQQFRSHCAQLIMHLPCPITNQNTEIKNSNKTQITASTKEIHIPTLEPQRLPEMPRTTAFGLSSRGVALITATKHLY